jgi:hypothetical protein
VKTLLTLAALLSLATPAAAYRQDYVLHSYCSATACYSYWGPRTLDNSARVLHVPADMNFNTNPAWGKGCRSCADVSK